MSSNFSPPSPFNPPFPTVIPIQLPPVADINHRSQHSYKCWIDRINQDCFNPMFNKEVLKKYSLNGATTQKKATVQRPTIWVTIAEGENSRFSFAAKRCY